MSSALTEEGKHFMKLTKKLREIEKIEMKLASGEKVDSLQLKKIDGKACIVHDLEAYTMCEASHELASARTKQQEATQDAASTAPTAAAVAAHASRQTAQCTSYVPEAEEEEWSGKRDGGNVKRQNWPKSATRRGAAGVVTLLGHGKLPDKVVITCQLRKGQPSWELPKGGLEHADHSNVEAAAAREFREETGIANSLTVLTPLPGYGQSRINWFLAQIGEESELMWEPIKDKDTIDAKCVPLREAMDILRSDHKQLLLKIVQDIKHGSLQWP
jgi:8-oxo-dGTP pyrophosphatase MutT (NUDIX family)